jgi:hypothetical protein
MPVDKFEPTSEPARSGDVALSAAAVSAALACRQCLRKPFSAIRHVTIAIVCPLSPDYDPDLAIVARRISCPAFCAGF